MPTSLPSHVAVSPDVLFQEVGDEGVLLNPAARRGAGRTALGLALSRKLVVDAGETGLSAPEKDVAFE